MSLENSTKKSEKDLLRFENDNKALSQENHILREKKSKYKASLQQRDEQIIELKKITEELNKSNQNELYLS
jgi:hypothetical protein